MSMAAQDREPCPWRIVEDAGGAYMFGTIGGVVWHGVGGIRNAPRGQLFEQTIARVKTRVPVVSGSFAVWGVVFSACDCTFAAVRKKEDPWNAILSGAAAGGILAARAGLKAAGKNALIGGVILAGIEGISILISRVLAPQMERMQEEQGRPRDTLEPPSDPRRPYFRKTPLNVYSPRPLVLDFGGSDDLDHQAASAQGFQDSFAFPSGGAASADSSAVGGEANGDKQQRQSSWKFW